MLWIYGFTLEILERGDLLPIPMTLNSNIFLPTLVNNDQDFMCLQNKPNFKYKLHPSVSQSEGQTGQPRPIRRQATLSSVHNLSLTEPRLSLRAGNQVRRLVMAGVCARLRLLQILSTPLHSTHHTSHGPQSVVNHRSRNTQEAYSIPWAKYYYVLP